MTNSNKWLPPGSECIGTQPERIEENGFYVVFERPNHGNAIIVINTRDQTQVLIVHDTKVGQLKMNWTTFI